MRKRKIQSITLKLSELKEYDADKQEKLAAQQIKDKTSGAFDGSGAGPSQISKVGPKSQQEIRQRIGLSGFQ